MLGLLVRESTESFIRHSQADISKVKNLLGYVAEFKIQQGIIKATPWYIKFLKKIK